jgi:hypothetical protein
MVVSDNRERFEQWRREKRNGTESKLQKAKQQKVILQLNAAI